MKTALEAWPKWLATHGDYHMIANITIDIARKVLTTVDAGLCKGVGIRKPGKMCVEAAVCYALDLPHGDDPKCVAQSIRSLKMRLNDATWSSNKTRSAGLRRLALAQLGSAGKVDNCIFSKNVVELVIRTSVPVALRAAASVCKNQEKRQALLDAASQCEAEGTQKTARQAKIAAYAAGALDACASADAAAEAAAYATNAAAAAEAAAYATAAAAYAAYADACASADVAADAAAAYAADASAASAAYAADATAYADVCASAAYAANAAYAADAYAANATNAAAAVRDKHLSAFAEGVVQILIKMNAPGCQWLFLTEAEMSKSF